MGIGSGDRALDHNRALLPGLTRAAADRRGMRIDAKKVPAAFHDLIPLALEWGIGDDGSRGYFADRAIAGDKAALAKALPSARRGEIQAWLDSLGPKGIAGAEAGALMFLLEAVEEMGI